MNSAGKQVYRVGDIDIDSLQGCVRQNGADRYLRPKAFQLLIFLLERRDRLVTKDELVEAIWGGTAVSDDALVQLVKEVRRALDDDPRKPQFIKTLPKIGYRFIGAVEECSRNTTKVETREVTTIELEYEREGSGEIVSDETLHEALVESVGNRTTGRRMVAAALLAAALISLALMSPYLSSHLLRWRTLSTSAAVLSPGEGKKAVAVMYFKNESGDRGLNWLSEGLADMLIADLSRSKKLTVLGREQLHLLMERAGHSEQYPTSFDDALEIGQKSHAEMILMGTFARLGDKIRVNVNLCDARDGHQTGSESVVADKPDDIFTQIDLLSLRLESDLGGSSVVAQLNSNLAAVMTDNLDAYRYYSLALEKAQAYHTTEAIGLWEKAIALDPEFAMAYARIGYTYTLVRVAEADKARSYLQKAYQLSNRLTEKDKLMISAWYALSNGDHSEGIRLLKEIINQYPMETDAYLRLGYQFQYAGRLEESIDTYKQALAVDPEAKSIYNALGFACSGLGRYDEAIASHRRYVELAPGEANAHDSLGMTYNEAGMFLPAIAEFNQALSLDPEFHFAILHLGDVYARQGQYKLAIAQYTRFIQVAPSNWDAAIGRHRLVLLYRSKGDLNLAEREAVRERTHNVDLGGSLLVALARSDLKQAAMLKEQLTGNGSVVPPQLGEKMLHYFNGYYALNSGRADEAIEQFKEALRNPPMLWNVDGIETCLADAYLQAGMLDQAIAEYERLVKVMPNDPRLHYQLAQAYEQKRDNNQARIEYERFIQLWKNADRDLPEVANATRRLVALS